MELWKLDEPLEKKGIRFEENFSCCSSCASFEINRDYDDFKGYKGYCFYHSQDRMDATEDGEIFLHYDAYDPLYTSKDIGDMIRETAESLGFEVEWNGDDDVCILIVGLDKEYFKDEDD